MGSEWVCPVFSDSEEGIISGLFGFKVSWGLVVKTGVESGAVVEGFDVVKDGGASLGEAGEAIFYDDADRVEFLRTLGRACLKSDRLRIGSASYV